LGLPLHADNAHGMMTVAPTQFGSIHVSHRFDRVQMNAFDCSA
jgi:hypothetical protein